MDVCVPLSQLGVRRRVCIFCKLNSYSSLLCSGHPLCHPIYIKIIWQEVFLGVVSQLTRMTFQRDSYRTSATEVFIVSMTIKNLLFYGFSNFMNDWAADDGPSQVLKTYGIVTMCIMGTSLPICELTFLFYFLLWLFGGARELGYWVSGLERCKVRVRTRLTRWDRCTWESHSEVHNAGWSHGKAS